MPEVSFCLKNPNEKNKPQLIYMFFSFGGNKRLKYSTRRKILPKNWNQNAKKSRSDNDLNDYLKKLKRDIEKIELNLRTSGITVSVNLLREKLDEVLEMNAKEKLNLTSFIEDYINKASTTKKEATIKGYKNTLKHLKEFETSKKKHFDFGDIDQSFYDSFYQYLVESKHFSVNTIGKQIKNLKVFLNDATEKKLNTNLDFKSRKFKVISEESDSVYLNRSEINRLMEVDFTNNKRLEKVRDLFIVGCNTGLRFSDFSNIKAENIKDNVIKLKTIKMNQTVVIPINKMVAEIMQKYKDDYSNSLPPAPSNQKTNEYLKEICKIACLDEMIQTSHFIGVNKITETFPKYKLITTHTARRSFATNLFLDDVPTKIIRDITGHKTDKAFYRYIKSSPEQQAQKLENYYNEKGL